MYAENAEELIQYICLRYSEEYREDAKIYKKTQSSEVQKRLGNDMAEIECFFLNSKLLDYSGMDLSDRLRIVNRLRKECKVDHIIFSLISKEKVKEYRYSPESMEAKKKRASAYYHANKARISERNKAERLKREKQGLCIYCGNVKASEGYKGCTECRTKRAKLNYTLVQRRKGVAV